MHLRLLIITILVIVHPALAQPCLEYEDKMIDPDGNSWNTLGWSAAVSIDLAIGGIVDIQTRKGRRDGYHGYVKADVFDAAIVAEGQIGRASCRERV